MIKINLDFVTHLFDVQRHIEKRLDGPLSNTFGISFETFQILESLAKKSDCATRGQLARRFKLSESQMGRKLTPLSKIGLISSKDSAPDQLRLTDAGLTLFENASRLVEETIDALPQHEVQQSALEDLEASLKQPNPPIFGNRPRPRP